VVANVLYCCVYRSSSDYHFLIILLWKFYLVTLKIWLFNSNPTVNSSPQGRFLYSFMGQFHLHELVQCPTRVTATTSSHLDLILTNSPQATTTIPCGSSDHHFVLTHFCACGISQCSDHITILLCQYHKLDVKLLD